MGAHPDDVEFGIGGILAAHRAAGDSVTILTLSRGSSAGQHADLQHESLAAAEIVGARLFLEDLSATEIGTGSAAADTVARVVAEVAPTIVYTHSVHDDEADHRATHEAVLAAAASVPTVHAFQSQSSTVDFRPTKFVSIDGYTDTKLALIESFRGEEGIRSYLDPEFVLATARYWGRFGGGTSVEPLETVREAATSAAEPVAASSTSEA